MTLPKGSIYISVTQIKRRFQYGADSKMLYHSFEWGTCFPCKIDNLFMPSRRVCLSILFTRRMREKGMERCIDGKEALSILCEMLVIHW